MPNTLYFGDNLDWMRKIQPASIDLIYLDPPFNSKAEYNKVWRGPTGQAPRASAQTFEDTWTWNQTSRDAYDDVLATGGQVAAFLRAMREVLNDNDIMAYMAMMAVRMQEFRRVLKDTGSIYLHCDPTASHYLKLLLDLVFGQHNFRNEIIWKRTMAHSSSKKFGPIHDVILYYTVSDIFTWNTPRLEYKQEYLEKYYKYDDGDGRLYWRNSITAAGRRRGSSGNIWRGFDPTSRGSHWKFTIENLDALDTAGKVYWPPKGGWPQIKRYRDELKGVAVSDIWDDINKINPAGSERLGYATQKPQALLERIVAASSNSGDVVLDPFCGCGTAVHAAQELGRKWIGIDITHVAIEVIERRLLRAFGPGHFTVEGRPRDTDDAWALARRNRYQFQWWATAMVGAHPFGGYKKGADGGVDGIAYFKTGRRSSGFAIIQVKSDKKVEREMIDKLSGVMTTKGADIGIFICLAQPTAPMRTDVVNAGKVAFDGEEYPRIQILTVDDLFEKKRPRMPPLYKDMPATHEDRVPTPPVVSPEELRRSPRLRLSIRGGKAAEKQGGLPLGEPLLVNSPQTRSRRRSGASVSIR